MLKLLTYTKHYADGIEVSNTEDVTKYKLKIEKEEAITKITAKALSTLDVTISMVTVDLNI